jgi:hypothetical protein
MQLPPVATHSVEIRGDRAALINSAMQLIIDYAFRILRLRPRLGIPQNCGVSQFLAARSPWFKAAHQLRAGGCKSKLVFLTIHIDDELVKACLADGALGYV